MQTEILAILLSIALGAFVMDMFSRRLLQQDLKNSRKELTELEQKYRDTLEKIHQLDTSRANKLLELQDKIDKIDLSLKLMAKK